VGGRSQYLERPFTIFLIDSQNVALRDFTLEDPAFWAIRLTGCNDSEIDGIEILTDLKVPNADGIDIDRCQRVRIVNCKLVTADDCISLKSCAGTAMYGDVKDIYIGDCDMVTTSGAITLGTESVGLIADVLVENCKVSRSHRGFAVRAREGGLIENVTFRNSEIQTRAFSDSWWGHGEALHVTAFRWSEPEHLGDGNAERLIFGKVSNIRFENLNVLTEAGTLVWAQKKGLIKDVFFENVSQRMEKQSKWQPRIDLRPNDIEPFVHRKHSAFEVVNSESVHFTKTNVSYTNREDFGELVVNAKDSSVLGDVEVLGN
jgi:polygalacturonase